MSDDIDLSEFDDWLEENFGHIAWGEGNTLNEHQQAIVQRNVELILDREKWSEKVERFQAIIDVQTDEEAKKNLIKRYIIQFNNAKFDDSDLNLDFSNFTFPVAVSFYLAEFGGHVSFHEAKFSGDASFVDAKFGGHAFFYDAKFRGKARFFAAEFKGEAYFDRAKFKGDEVSFFDTEFRDKAYFKSAMFGVDANFHNAKFGGDAGFFTAEFGGDADFREAEFSGTAYFGGVEFDGELSDAHFTGPFFLSTRQCKLLSLTRSTFHSSATFIIEECNEAPDFRETKFDRPPNLSRLNIKETPQVDRFLLNNDQTLVDKWRALKRLAIDGADHEKAGLFFANEMAAKRGTEISDFWPLLFSGIYYAFSNFGQSYFRPTAWLAFFGTFFATLYYVLLPNALAGWDRVLFSAEYSIRNLIPFLGSLFRFSARPVTEGFATGFEKNLSLINEAHGGIDLFIYLGVVEQLIGGILFFLLLLGLRNVFRMK